MRPALLACLALVLAPAMAHAQAEVEIGAPVDAGVPDAGPLDAGAIVTPPTLVHDSPAPYPPEAAQKRLDGEVQLSLTLDADGIVARAQLVHGVDPLLDQAALEAAMSLEFTPAQMNGTPVPATLGFVYRFEAPPLPPPEPRGSIAGEVLLRGRNARVAGASVIAHRVGSDASVEATTDADGRFTLEVPAGAWELAITRADLDPFARTEQVTAGQKLTVRYFATSPKRAFESTVVGERDREEVSRVDLRGDELREVPGTMGGDPFRAIMSLPGVAEPVSGLAFPIVRGAAPASTGWFLDGVELPNLFHFFLLSAVVHPEFISGLDFYPSAYPAEYGRFTGGVVNAQTATGRTDRTHGEVSVDLINTGVFLETPLHLNDETISVAVGGRVSYLGVGLSLAEDLNLVDPGGYGNYWDYQARAEWKPSGSRGTWRIFFFGSHDEAGSTDPAQASDRIDSTFHRADLRWRGPWGAIDSEAAITLGYDKLILADETTGDTQAIGVRLNLSWKRGPLTLRGGSYEELRYAEIVQKTTDINQSELHALDQSVWGTQGGAYVEASIEAGTFTIVPGLRFDLYQVIANKTTATTGFVLIAGDTVTPTLEPRLTIRDKVTSSTTLKLGSGLYHQPPTLLIQLPAVGLLSLDAGLQSAINTALGVEQRIDPLAMDLEVSVFWSERLELRELEIEDPDVLACETTNARCQLDPLRARQGRTIGLEVMLRRRLTEKLFGWLAYTLSRTTRVDPNFGVTYPDDFDQTHIINLVLSYELPHGFRVGVGLHAHSGEPYTPYKLITLPGIVEVTPRPDVCGGGSIQGTQCWVPQTPLSGRLPFFYRVDARVEKSWELDRYTLTLYLDVLNASLQDEVLSRNYGFDSSNVPTITDTSVPIVVPMLGVRGDF